MPKDINEIVAELEARVVALEQQVANLQAQLAELAKPPQQEI